MNIQVKHSPAKDFIPHDEAKDFLLGKRGTPCREQLESLVQYSVFTKALV